MSLDWQDVSVWFGPELRHAHADVKVISDPPAMFVWEDWGTTVYTNIVNTGTNRFVGFGHNGKRYVLKIGASGGCGCG